MRSAQIPQHGPTCRSHVTADRVNTSQSVPARADSPPRMGWSLASTWCTLALRSAANNVRRTPPRSSSRLRSQTEVESATVSDGPPDVSAARPAFPAIIASSRTSASG
eukprot:scaffold290043_cov33-Tisochrysis_lutea.AAC.2